MRRGSWLLLLVLGVSLQAAPPPAPARHARNVILFLADAGGIPTLSAASLHGYGASRRLFVQHMPHIGLSSTETATDVVTDSAAGMTAIVTGVRTRNAVISESADAEPGRKDGAPLKSILEYAEEHGLATGFVTNDEITGATPAALYAKANDRNLTAEIFLQLFKPRFGDGVDFAFGPGRSSVEKALHGKDQTIASVEQASGRRIFERLEDVPADARRPVVLTDTEDFDFSAAVHRALDVVSKSRRGYFLMIECDVHTNRVRRGLDRVVMFDKVIRDIASSVGPETLVLFTADHSYDLRTHAGNLADPLLADVPQGDAPITHEKSQHYNDVWMDDSHTGEEVLVAAQGPGAEQVHGYMANTDLFTIMMNALGWSPSRSRSTSSR